MGLLDQQRPMSFSGKRTATPYQGITAMDAAKFIAEATPIIGDAMAAKEIYDELQKPDPNLKLVAALGGAALVGLVPGLGDALASGIKKGARGLLNVADRIEVDPSMMGSNFSNIKFKKPAPDTGKPYEMSGEKLADKLEKTPTAFNFLNPDQALPVGAKYTGIEKQQPTALRNHRSAGLLSTETVEPEIGSISDLYGRSVMSIVGDQTDRKTVTHYNDKRLLNPVKSMAGFRYADVDGQGYAGAKTATNSKINEAMKHDKPYFMSAMMGEQSGDFAQHQGDMYGEAWNQLQNSNSSIIGENAVKINNHIKNISVPKSITVKDANGNILKNAKGENVKKTIQSKPFKDLDVDIEDPMAIFNLLNMLPAGSQRAYFLKGMDRAGLFDMGAPTAFDARLAVADANQIGMDWGSVGYRGFTPDLEKGVFPTNIQNSTTYDTGYDKIGNAQTFLQGSRGIPAALIYRDLGAELRKKGTGGGLLMTPPFYKVLESSPKRAIQKIDDEISEVGDTFLEIERTKGRREALEYANKILSGGYGLLSR